MIVTVVVFIFTTFETKTEVSDRMDDLKQDIRDINSKLDILIGRMK